MTTTRAAEYLIVLIFFMISLSCENARRTSSFKKQYREIYIEQFKLEYFRQLLSKSYNNSNAVREIILADHSGFTEPILREEDYKLIDSLTLIDNQSQIADSTDGYKRAEGSQGKRPLGFMVNKLTSKWLDSLAKRRLRINGVPKSWAD